MDFVCEAYQEGMAMGRQGFSATLNPYPQNSLPWWSWFDGHDDGCAVFFAEASSGKIAKKEEGPANG